MGAHAETLTPLTTQDSNGMQAGLEHEKDRLKLLLDMTNTMVLNLEPRDLLRAISASIRQDIRCDSVGVWLPDSDRLVLRQLAQDFPESNGFSKEDLTQPSRGPSQVMYSRPANLLLYERTPMSRVSGASLPSVRKPSSPAAVCP